MRPLALAAQRRRRRFSRCRGAWTPDAAAALAAPNAGFETPSGSPGDSLPWAAMRANTSTSSSMRSTVFLPISRSSSSLADHVFASSPRPRRLFAGAARSTLVGSSFTVRPGLSIHASSFRFASAGLQLHASGLRIGPGSDLTMPSLRSGTGSRRNKGTGAGRRSAGFPSPSFTDRPSTAGLGRCGSVLTAAPPE